MTRAQELVENFRPELVTVDGKFALKLSIRPKEEIIAEIKEHKQEMIEVLKQKKAEAEENVRALRNSEKLIKVRWMNGSPLSGWTVFGPAAEMLKEIGLARDVAGWGTLIARETIEALGEEFSLAAAQEYNRPAREEQARIQAEREAKFSEARKTGKLVALRSWMAECDDPREECSTDIVTELATPDGRIKIERRHTW